MRTNIIEKYLTLPHQRQILHYVKEAHLENEFKNEILRQRHYHDIYKFINEKMIRLSNIENFSYASTSFSFNSIEDGIIRNNFYNLLKYIEKIEKFIYSNLAKK